MLKYILYVEIQHKTLNKSQLWELITMYMIYANMYTLTLGLFFVGVKKVCHVSFPRSTLVEWSQYQFVHWITVFCFFLLRCFLKNVKMIASLSLHREIGFVFFYTMFILSLILFILFIYLPYFIYVLILSVFCVCDCVSVCVFSQSLRHVVKSQKHPHSNVCVVMQFPSQIFMFTLQLPGFL